MQFYLQLTCLPVPSHEYWHKYQLVAEEVVKTDKSRLLDPPIEREGAFATALVQPSYKVSGNVKWERI